MKNWLKDNYVILTGAAGGIGRALTKFLISSYGAKVIGIGRTQAKLQSLKEELGEKSDYFTYQVFDVSVQENWENFSKYLQEQSLSPVLLINNAGIFPTFQKALDTSEDVFRQIMQTNFYAATYAVQAIAPLLRGVEKVKPAVYNVCSSAALCTVVGTAAYSASKSALKAYSEALQLEEGERLHVGIIFPGTAKTELFRNEENMEGSLLDSFAITAEKMGAKIGTAIYQRKQRAVLGFDADLMNLTAKFAPVKGLALIRWVMKTSKAKVFKNVFDYEDAKEENTQE